MIICSLLQIITESKLTLSQSKHVCESVLTPSDWNDTNKVAFDATDPVQLYITQDVVDDRDQETFLHFEKYSYPIPGPSGRQWIWHNYQIQDYKVRKAMLILNGLLGYFLMPGQALKY